MERRLLTLLDETSATDHDRRASLQQTLAEIRRSRASLEIRLSPHHPGAELTTGEQASVHVHHEMHHTDSQVPAAR